MNHAFWSDNKTIVSVLAIRLRISRSEAKRRVTEAAATFNPLPTTYAAAGMCNPADEHPCTTGSPNQEAIYADTRTAAQRNHDALVAMGRSILASGELGQHNGLPVSIVVSTTLRELEEVTVVGITATSALSRPKQAHHLSRTTSRAAHPRPGLHLSRVPTASHHRGLRRGQRHWHRPHSGTCNRNTQLDFAWPRTGTVGRLLTALPPAVARSNAPPVRVA
jgi:Domain of unknown function (DUF222)